MRDIAWIGEDGIRRSRHDAFLEAAKTILTAEDPNTKNNNLEGNAIEKIAYEIFNMLKSYQVNFLVDLHESREFYKNNSQNYGQTIVLDCYDNELLGIVSSFAEELNKKILSDEEKFEILIKPIEGCVTYAASCQLGVSAFTFETCKKIPLVFVFYSL